jgi:hypothetical protein
MKWYIPGRRKRGQPKRIQDITDELQMSASGRLSREQSSDRGMLLNE